MAAISANANVQVLDTPAHQVIKAEECKGIKRKRYFVLPSENPACRRKLIKSDESDAQTVPAAAESVVAMEPVEHEAQRTNADQKQPDKEEQIQESHTVDFPTIPCIDLANTTSYEEMKHYLELGLNANGCGRPLMCCADSQLALAIKNSGNGHQGPLGENPMALLDDPDAPEYIRMLRIVVLLLKHGAEVNGQAERGYPGLGTSAHYAKSTLALYILLINGADMSATIKSNFKTLTVHDYLQLTSPRLLRNALAAFERDKQSVAK